MCNPCGAVYQSCGLIRPALLRPGGPGEGRNSVFRQCVRWIQTGVMQPARATYFGFVPRLAAFYAALFILPGIQMPFFPVWLKAKGLDPKMIGIVLAVPMVARVLAIPVVTRAADRRNAIRG